MTAANFPQAILFGFTLPEEGGFSDNPDDPGGATQAGITLTTFRKIMKNPALTVADLKAITPEAESTIYRLGYWATIRGDELPAGIDLTTFDFGVNAGPGESEMLLQRAVGVPADGILGPISMAAIAKASPCETIVALAGLQKAHYEALPTFHIFGAGWLARNTRRATAALKLIPTTKETT